MELKCDGRPEDPGGWLHQLACPSLLDVLFVVFNIQIYQPADHLLILSTVPSCFPLEELDAFFTETDRYFYGVFLGHELTGRWEDFGGVGEILKRFCPVSRFFLHEASFWVFNKA